MKKILTIAAIAVICMAAAFVSCKKKEVRVSSVSVTPATATVEAGKTVQLTAEVLPADAKNKNVTWSSGIEARATVSASGLVTIPSTATAGTVTITATTADGGKTANSVITVTLPPPPFVAITDIITFLPETATAGVPLMLYGWVEPENATNHTIVWSVADAGTTGATIVVETDKYPSLHTTATGTVKVLATVAGGKTETTAYTQEFSIKVIPPTYSIFAGPDEILFGSLQTPYAQPTALTVGIINTGTGAIKLNALPTVPNFTLAGLTATDLAGGEMATFTIRPNANLAVGEYERTFTVSGSNGVSATIKAEFSVVEPTPVITAPAFTAHPQNRTVNRGADATFTVAVTGSPEPTLQWQYFRTGEEEWIDVHEMYPGSTAATLTFTLVSMAYFHGYQFRCIATNAAGSVVSNAATLSLNPFAPEIAGIPFPAASARYAGIGGSVEFEASFENGIPAPSCKWQVSTNSGASWTDVTGAGSTTTNTIRSGSSSSTLRLTDVTLAMHGNRYRCVASNTAGSAYYGGNFGYELWVETNAPRFTAQPGNMNVNAGQDASFGVATAGTAPISLQWQVSTNNGSSWANVSGATGATLNLTNVTAQMHGNRYRCLASNPNRSGVESFAATLTVNHRPVITAHPANKTVDAGQYVSFSVAATGFPEPTYQWRISTDGLTWTTNIPDATGADKATLTFASVPASLNGARFQCYASNAQGGIYSYVVTLTVNTAAPTIGFHPASITHNEGSTATFYVTLLSGIPAPSFAWQVSTDNSTWQFVTDNSSANSRTLTLNNVSWYMNKWRYRCIITNAAGSVTSYEARLTVCHKPVITTQPVVIEPTTQFLEAEQNIRISIIAQANPVVTSYQWYYTRDTYDNWHYCQDYTNGNNNWVSGSQTPTLSRRYHKAMSGAWYYKCAVTNSHGTTWSNVIRINVM